jgi:hypothetical protein
MKNDATKLRDGASCKVIGGTHKGKSGAVRDIKTGKRGHVSVTVVQSDGARFKTLAKNIEVWLWTGLRKGVIAIIAGIGGFIDSGSAQQREVPADRVAATVRSGTDSGVHGVLDMPTLGACVSVAGQRCRATANTQVDRIYRVIAAEWIDQPKGQAEPTVLFTAEDF